MSWQLICFHIDNVTWFYLQSIFKSPEEIVLCFVFRLKLFQYTLFAVLVVERKEKAYIIILNIPGRKMYRQIINKVTK